MYRLQILGLKNKARIMHFEKPRKSASVVDVMVIVMVMSRHWSYHCRGSNLMSQH